MKRGALCLVLAAGIALQAGSAPAQVCRHGRQTLTVPQDSYVQITRHGQEPPWLYLYVPDIRRRFGQSRFRPFEIWLVEGVYGRVFLESGGPVTEGEFARVRKSQNVRVRPVTVRYDENTAAAAGGLETVTIAKDTFTVEVEGVKTGLFAADTITVTLCH